MKIFPQQELKEILRLHSLYLKSANLEGANLRGADMTGTNIEGANMEPIKQDFFMVLINSIPELEFLERSILDGKIDGSTYEGDCACLCGTIEKTGNHKIKRNSSRPIECFFMGIRPGDTPINSQFSKTALSWLQEFKDLIGNNKKE